MIQVKNLTKTFNDKVAVNNLDFCALEGKIHGLLGPNGSGKTTLIRCIIRIIVADSGTVTMDGKSIEIKDIYKIGYMPEERGLYKKMKVGEQIIFFARLKGMSQESASIRAKQLLKELELHDVWNKKIEDLSKGMAQKIQFINTIINDPKILILDEPFSGFDPVNSNIIRKKVEEYRDKGAIVILSTHDMNSVESICDEFTLINKSEKILAGDVQDTLSRYSSGNYTLCFGDCCEHFMDELSSFCSFEKIDLDNRLFSTLNIKLKENVSVKKFLDFANENSEIIEFKRQRVTMNDIFLRAVDGEIL